MTKEQEEKNKRIDKILDRLFWGGALTVGIGWGALYLPQKEGLKEIKYYVEILGAAGGFVMLGSRIVSRFLTWPRIYRARKERKSLKENPAQAAKKYRAEAEQGDTDAQVALANLYEDGKGVKQDYAEAYFWESVAETYGGCVRVQEPGDDLPVSHLTPGQKAAIDKRVKEWKPSPAKEPA